MQQTVLITGASGGIGRACALEFARKGYWVALHCHRQVQQAQALREEIRAMGGQAVVVQGDVSDPAAVEAFTREALAFLGHLDVLVCNAGIAHSALLQDMTSEQIHRVMAVNATGTMLCARAALPYLLDKKAGHIITVSSMWGVQGAAMEVVYSASKAAVIGFTRALAQEVGPSGIAVNCVAPGVIDTEMNAHLSPADLEALCEQTPLGRIGTPQEVAVAVRRLAESTFITGQVLQINGGIVL